MSDKVFDLPLDDPGEENLAVVASALSVGLQPPLGDSVMRVLCAVAEGLIAAEGLPNEAKILASLEIGIAHRRRRLRDR